MYSCEIVRSEGVFVGLMLCKVVQSGVGWSCELFAKICSPEGGRRARSRSDIWSGARGANQWQEEEEQQCKADHHPRHNPL